MNRYPHYQFVLVGGFVLSLQSGYINSVSLLGFHQAVSHISGVSTQLGISLSQLNWENSKFGLFLLLSFFCGSTLCGVIVGSSRFKLGHHYGLVLMLQSFLLTIAIAISRNTQAMSVYLIAMSCGLQNAMATSYSGAVVRTTHMTGIVTDLGIVIGHFVREGKAELWKIDLYLILLAGFIAGGGLGWLAFSQWAIRSLWISALSSGLIGASYFAGRLWRQNQKKRS